MKYKDLLIEIQRMFSVQAKLITARCRAETDTLVLQAVDWAWGAHQHLVKCQ